MFAQDVSDIDKLAAELQRDGVVIESALGSGEPTESHDRIAALVREVPFPVYVALVDSPSGMVAQGGRKASESVAALLHRRIGGEGMYVVAVRDGSLVVTSFGLDADETLLSLVRSANEDEVEARAKKITREQYVLLPAVVEAETAVLEAEAAVAKARRTGPDQDWEATISDDEATELAERAVALEASARWSPDSGLARRGQVREASKGLSVAVGITLGVSIALLLGQTIFGWPRRTRAEAEAAAEKRRRTHGKAATPPRPDTLVADFAVERDDARSRLDAFVARIERSASTPVVDSVGLEQALLARDVAELVLADAERDSNALAALGASALVRTGDRALARGLDGRTARFRPCFFDPRHGHTNFTHAWEFGEGGVEVPCCGKCRKALAAGKAPRSLHRPSRRGAPRPYWHDDDVWASTGFGALDEDFVRTVAQARRGKS